MSDKVLETYSCRKCGFVLGTMTQNEQTGAITSGSIGYCPKCVPIKGEIAEYNDAPKIILPEADK